MKLKIILACSLVLAACQAKAVSIGYDCDCTQPPPVHVFKPLAPNPSIVTATTVNVIRSTQNPVPTMAPIELKKSVGPTPGVKFIEKEGPSFGDECK